MGFQRDQSLPSEDTYSNSTPEEPPPSYRPPLPPRNHEQLRMPTLPWSQQDPRTASTDSLVPSGSSGGRRTLLLIYIHGFLGDETSFQSFPAHVHNIVTPLLEETHAVHTKIYPKYRSRKHIVYARDAFSSWLTPHESPTTDVILCGHSMGGLLSAEVALMPNSQNQQSLQHRILGTLNFDVPFLGMHPGVVGSGLSSIFQPAAKEPGNEAGGGELGPHVGSPGASSLSLQSGTSGATNASEKQRLDSVSSDGYASPLGSPNNDPNYNPPFPNDVRLPIRKGWEGPLHFMKKHSNDILSASKTYVTSHLEFGGAMVDYVGLKKRYQAIRALEDVDDSSETSFRGNSGRRRVRFINYYTASTGRPKPPKRDSSANKLTAPNLDAGRRGDASSGASVSSVSQASTPRISVDGVPEEKDSASKSVVKDSASASDLKDHSPADAHDASHDVIKAEDDSVDEGALDSDGAVEQPMTQLHPEPEAEPADAQGLSREQLLPPVPEVPEEPPELDISQYEDKDSRKLAEKSHERRVKAYKQAVKDRERALKDRQKLLAKREKQQQKDQERQEKDEKKRLEREAKERAKQDKAAASSEAAAAAATTSVSEQSDPSTRGDVAEVATAELGEPKGTKSKKKRDRKFCLLPPRRYQGQADSAWVRVFMKDVDEVGAHCGLFFSNYPHYEDLVLETSQKIAEWVEHAEEVRARRD